MRPETEAELAEAIRDAAGPLEIRGGGTRGVGAAGARLETGGLAGISLYEPGALTLVAGAGTPLAEVEAALAAENQRLAFEPMDHRGLMGTAGAPTLGGIFAANISGPRRIQAGAARDFLLGVRFVDGAGQILRNGGRVMKNVTGYDLVKLMAGAHGTLGVLSEVALKVLPRPETEASLEIAVPDAAAAVALLSAALGTPYEVSGAAYDPGRGLALLRVEGFEASVGYRLERLAAELAGDLAGEAQRLSAAASARLWQGIRDVAAFHGLPGDVWRISCKPSEAPALAARIGAERLLFDWGGGLIWALTPEGDDLRARAGAYDGHATLVRASAETRAQLGRVEPQPAPLAMLARGLRAKFDPRGILNPGVMG
ncbi:FAD-binding protein [Pseudodonghicola flavimaris]|uniref:FAD-binding protein n=1 Tax=Pseudodonghicola flavimaris TaxID=3050036 RepID=A0ABT7EWF5_9RHOB|nr:FAD-binding protein [Pseudodonghicola flavimaris]MDK3016671.1 FAD-binding protein [Pseudodonghicola flavimaris]